MAGCTFLERRAVAAIRWVGRGLTLTLAADDSAADSSREGWRASCSLNEARGTRGPLVLNN